MSAAALTLVRPFPYLLRAHLLRNKRPHRVETELMKAVLLREFGGPDKLSYEDVSDPAPSLGEVLIRVSAVSINRSFDIGVRRGRYSSDLRLPLVLGADPTGIVAARGPGVTFPNIGDRVAVMATIACGHCRLCRSGDPASCTDGRTVGVHRWGGYAEYVAVPASNLAVIPDALGFEDATVIARHGSAAYNFLVRRGGLKAGETALILGASGALGSFAVQIAKLTGARVIAAAGSDERAGGRTTSRRRERY
jgi:NADPH:quinone reductase